MNKDTMFPISLDEFKSFFMREAGLEYQPFPSWVKTTWDAGDICLDENVYYKSLIDLNHTQPSAQPETPIEPEQPEEPEEPTEPSEEVVTQAEEPTTPIWEALTVIYEAETSYPVNTIVYYNNQYWKATENTDSLPGTPGMWLLVQVATEFPNARPWANPVAYSEGDKVIAIVNYKPGVWVSNMNDNYSNPATNTPIPDQDPVVSQWELSDDDTEDMEDWILDLDILRAMGEASFKFNKTLFTQEKGKMIFLYLTMFFLVYDRQMAANGMSGAGGSAGPVIHRTVGKMSVTYMESKLFANYPSYEFLATNDYGRKAFNLMMPYLRGGVRILMGGSTGD